MSDLEVPVGRGWWLRLYGWKVDDKRTDDEYEAAARRAEAHGSKPPRRERMPHGRWFVTAALQPYHGEAQTREQENQGRYIGMLAKGWYRVGWSRYRFKWVEAELAVGGEDSMVQLSASSPLGGAAVGVRVPRSWLAQWVYERRTLLGVKFGYIGSLAQVSVMHDERMADMASYYRRSATNGDPASYVTGAMLRNGWQGYVGGAHFFERQVLDRLFGKREYTTLRGDEVPVVIRMPEGDYPATCTVVREQWKRPRLRWAKRQVATDLEVPNPPMFAGKGENSWDLDDDGYYSVHSRAAKTVKEAVRQYELSVLDQRARHGQPRTVA